MAKVLNFCNICFSKALEECLRTVRRDPNVNISKVIDVANVRAELIDMQKRYATLKERLDTEMVKKKKKILLD